MDNDYRQSFVDKIQYIVWDWNGTIIDDVHVCVDIMNELLTEHGLPTIGLKSYRRVFDFPVKEYYRKLGFNFEEVPFEVVGQEFINRYNTRLSGVSLQPGASELMEDLRSAGKMQILVSARNHDALIRDVRDFGLDRYFDEIIGLDNDLARGKKHLVEEFFRVKGIDPKQTLFIGDTVHDCDIAKQLGAHVFLVSNGHHSASRLLSCNNFVYANLVSLAEFLFNA